MFIGGKVQLYMDWTNNRCCLREVSLKVRMTGLAAIITVFLTASDRTVLNFRHMDASTGDSYHGSRGQLPKHIQSDSNQAAKLFISSL